VIPSSSANKAPESRSRCEAVVAVFKADEFRGGTSARGVTGDVTGSELAKVCQQSHMSVMGCNSIPPQGSRPEILRSGWPMESRRGAVHGAVRSSQGFETKAETPKELSGECRMFGTKIQK